MYMSELYIGRITMVTTMCLLSGHYSRKHRRGGHRRVRVSVHNRTEQKEDEEEEEEEVLSLFRKCQIPFTML